MILLAFLLPLAIYLLALGLINRHRHPLLISGVWDFIGLLFAVSGFLFFGGPAALSGLEDRWRMYWLLGQSAGESSGQEGGWPLWGILSAVYFVVVVAGAGLLLARRRRLTTIYNVTPVILEQALTEACSDLGLAPQRSGNRFVFIAAAGKAGPEAFSTLSPPTDSPEGPRPPLAAPAPAILHLDSFPAMNHVTLRWEPANPPLRHSVETALAQRLREAAAPDSELGSWLILVGSTLLGFVAIAGLGLLALRLWLA